MKTKTPKKDFDTVKTFRVIKDKISKEIRGMTYKQLMEYFEKTKLKTQKTKKKNANHPTLCKQYGGKRHLNKLL